MSPPKTDRPNYLRLVERSSFNTLENGTQQSLFPMQSPELLCIVHVPSLAGNEFLQLLSDTSATHIFDLRVMPRFDLPRLTRRRAFDAFAHHRMRYYDIAAIIQKSWTDALFLSGEIGKRLSFFLAEINSDTSSGPILVLVDSHEDLKIAVDVLPRQLPQNPHGEWTVVVIS